MLTLSISSSTTPSGAIRRAGLMLLVGMVGMILASCRGPAVRIIPADRAVVPLPAGKPYTPAVKGWFVPDARMSEILERGL